MGMINKDVYIPQEFIELVPIRFVHLICIKSILK